MDWQPIQSAPKDGTYILLTAFVINRWRVGEGRWFDDEDHPDDPGLWSNFGHWEPTHWAPMPDPPA
jgi:hypothetical protein